MSRARTGIIACFTALFVLLSGCGAPPDLRLSEEELKQYQEKLFYQNLTDLQGADPFVLYVEEGEHAGAFLMYATSDALGGQGFEVCKSTDLTHWENLGPAFYPQGESWGSIRHWAPEVIADEGRYYLFYSAQWGDMDYGLYVSAAVADDPAGPFAEVVTEEKSAMEPLIRFEDHAGEIPEELRSEITGYKGTEGYIKVIDASPFVDPVSGKKYLYMIADIGTKYTKNSFVMGMEMEDWTTPRYETLTRLTQYERTTVGGEEKIEEGGNTNEGCSVLYHDGSYFLTFSVNTYTSLFYQVRQAIGESPLGPFTKVLPEDGGTVISTEILGIRQSAGHSAFFTVGDELFMTYHTFYNDSNIDGGRKPAVERLTFVQNQKGRTVLQANGPTLTPQPQAEVLSGYKNVAGKAKVECSNPLPGSDPQLLTDGFIPMHAVTPAKGFEAAAGTTKIRLQFEDPLSLCGLLIYNSRDPEKRFTEIESVLLETDRGTAELGPLTYDSSAYDEKGRSAVDFPASCLFRECRVRSAEIVFTSDHTVEIPEIWLIGKD